MSADVVEALISAAVSNAPLDVVGVYDQNFVPVFQAARAIKASLSPDSKLMEHPVENGKEITDFRILLPVKIELSLILNGLTYLSVYQQIKQLYTEGTLLIVQTLADVYTNQVIQSLPHEESGEHFDALVLALTLREVEIKSASYASLPAVDPAPAHTQSSDTVNRGTIQPAVANGSQTQKSSTLYNLFN